ncbi:MAG TPA: SH3 domain-containing protein [Devosiaceae bacterium]|jgi:SH3-like domain-containing protein|nr:SH3 domain-containing protein [Devosiaceae bacterium]
MINRFGLLRPSRYVPVLVAGVAIVMLVPADSPNDEGEPGAVIAAAATPVSEPPPPAPAIKIAEVSQKPPPEPVRQSVAAVPEAPALPTEASDLKAPVPDEVALLRTMRAVEAESDTAPAEEVAESAEEPVPEEADEEPTYRVARVGSSALNVRAGPSSSNRKLFVLRPGEPVRIAEMDGNWARIVRGDGDEGWAFGRYLNGLNGDAVAAAPAPAAEAAPVEDADRAQATATRQEAPPVERGTGRYARAASDVPARAAPSPGAAQLFVLPAGERVKIAEIRGPWVHVITDSGVSGWVRFR